MFKKYLYMEDLHVLLISIRSNRERLGRALDELYSVGLGKCVTVIDGTSVEEAKKNYIGQITWKAYKNIQNLGSTNIISTWNAVGQHMSHRAAWNYVEREQISCVLIVEDHIIIRDVEKAKFAIQQISSYRRNKQLNRKHFISTDMLFMAISNMLYQPECIIEHEMIQIRQAPTLKEMHCYVCDYNMALRLLQSNPVTKPLGAHIHTVASNIYTHGNSNKKDHEFDFKLMFATGIGCDITVQNQITHYFFPSLVYFVFMLTNWCGGHNYCLFDRATILRMYLCLPNQLNQQKFNIPSCSKKLQGKHKFKVEVEEYWARY